MRNVLSRLCALFSRAGHKQQVTQSVGSDGDYLCWSKYMRRPEEAYVIVSKHADNIVFLSDDNVYPRTWVQDLILAKSFEYPDSYNGTLVGLWSGGEAADTLEIEEIPERHIIDIDKLSSWEAWDMPNPTYCDSESGCRRHVICGPKYPDDVRQREKEKLEKQIVRAKYRHELPEQDIIGASAT